MVSFSNNQNQSILLETSNYQFPNFDGEDAFDKNWLQINIEVIDNQKKWKNTDPFLLSYDWLTIAQWFSDRANFKQPKWEWLGFIEPNITFQLKESKGIWQIYRIIKYKNINFQNNKEELKQFTELIKQKKMTYREINILYKTI